VFAQGSIGSNQLDETATQIPDAGLTGQSTVFHGAMGEDTPDTEHDSE
jgi:hypothetical protein